MIGYVMSSATKCTCGIFIVQKDSTVILFGFIGDNIVWGISGDLYDL